MAVRQCSAKLDLNALYTPFCNLVSGKQCLGINIQGYVVNAVQLQSSGGQSVLLEDCHSIVYRIVYFDYPTTLSFLPGDFLTLQNINLFFTGAIFLNFFFISFSFLLRNDNQKYVQRGSSWELVALSDCMYCNMGYYVPYPPRTDRSSGANKRSKQM
ncbi:hypothetical protein BCR41DRAFT_371282 [Lobosporangium transversale]|uniref:Uncharacterized protein n=1 Tax=Lobosporangium transversale TaxID=64571 RepID=A0A1Y2GLS2_9FUNG|nr:hypothetical protein BCR41DRAFT_371282 [Lobosporangium transversale]ORZ13761.1 hypothetical protein BCR41DRAFT_371282 [Lobosporangium transversale]|eukprot:XP_021880545.1 hypothetical protein BCR41DRAFT_371282 [Lobosporangium transversale]